MTAPQVVRAGSCAESRFRNGPSVVPALLLAASVCSLVVSMWATLVTPHRADGAAVAREGVFALSWIGLGAVALWLRRWSIATRILTLALVLAADFAGSFGLQGQAPHARVLQTLTVFLVPLQAPVAAHLLLTYPSGRLADSTARRIVIAAYGLGLVESMVWAVSHTQAFCPECAVPLTPHVLPASVARTAVAVIACLWLVLAVLVGWQLLRQFRAAGQRQRGLLRLPYLSIAVAVALFAVLVALGAPQGRSPWGLSPTMLTVMQVVALLGVPLALLIGLLRERLSYKRIGDFVVASSTGSAPDLEKALGRAVGDPGLRIAFPLDDGYVDLRGGPLPAPRDGPTTMVTPVGPPDAPLALVLHDRSLADEPALLTAAGSATRLLLENARLHAEVRAQLMEVRESRSRIVEAANLARVRLERDLHDGAQQRLLAIGLALRLLEERPGDAEILTHAQEEVTGALSELRALAAGIHPSVLTDFGLRPALDALARRIGPLVTVETRDAPDERLPDAVEAAAYFATAEAVSNSVKHADATRVAVIVEWRPAHLLLTVSDDGRGGADPRGGGLIGIRDRLASVDGTLAIDSRPGHGTRLTMSLPLSTAPDHPLSVSGAS